MLLGAPLVAACRDEAARSIEGTLVDTGMRRGHAMRDVRGIPAVPEGRWRRTGVVVIGAGVAGLGAAWWLKRNGRSDVTVIELDDVGHWLPERAPQDCARAIIARVASVD